MGPASTGKLVADQPLRRRPQRGLHETRGPRKLHPFGFFGQFVSHGGTGVPSLGSRGIKRRPKGTRRALSMPESGIVGMSRYDRARMGRPQETRTILSTRRFGSRGEAHRATASAAPAEAQKVGDGGRDSQRPGSCGVKPFQGGHGGPEGALRS